MKSCLKLSVSPNPWWDPRQVTSLIEQAHFREADASWSEILQRIGDSKEDSPELALYLHRFVIKAWLDLGEVARARAVFEQISQSSRDQPELSELELRLLDAEEALVLGESVRPTDMPWDQRWVRQVLPHIHKCKPLRAWYPGRVRAVQRSKVEIVFALPAEDPSQRMVYSRTFSRKAWRNLTDLAPNQYFEMGEYGSEILILGLPRS